MRYIQRLNKGEKQIQHIYTKDIITKVQTNTMRYIQRLNIGANKYNEIYTKAKQRCKQIQ